DSCPLFVRISATDWTDGGWDLEQSIALSRGLKELGVDAIDCSSGGNVESAKIPVGPGYQVPVRASGAARSRDRDRGGGHDHRPGPGGPDRPQRRGRHRAHRPRAVARSLLAAARRPRVGTADVVAGAIPARRAEGLARA